MQKVQSCFIKLYSNQKETEGNIKYLGKGISKVILSNNKYAITPGQACVIYKKNELLGGGWIIKDF